MNQQVVGKSIILVQMIQVNLFTPLLFIAIYPAFSGSFNKLI